MPRLHGNFNELSAADIVAAIDALADRARDGEDVTHAMLCAINMLDRTHCRTVGDAVAMLSVVQTLLHDAQVSAQTGRGAEGDMLEVAARYQHAALTFLTSTDAYIRSEEIRGGATIN